MNDSGLEQRISQLEHRVEQLMQLVDSDFSPFVYHMMEAEAIRTQVQRVHALMNDYGGQIKRGEETRSHAHFERSVYEIFPDRNGDYHFAEGIVRTLGRSGQYVNVYDYMMEDGMNLDPLSGDNQS